MRYEEGTLGTADDHADADGVTVLSYRDAVKAAREWWLAKERRDQGVPDPRSGPYTVNDALDDYLKHFVSEGKKSEDKTRRAIEVHIRPEFGKVALDKLTTKRIKDWQYKLAASDRRVRTKPGAEQRFAATDTSDDAVRARRSTANRLLTVLKAALNHAFAERHAHSDAPWRAVKPFRNVDAPVIHYLQPDEVTRLINTCEPDFRRFVQGALLTGCRYGELTRLIAGDVNHTAGTITIRQAKGGKPRHIALNDEGQEFFAAMTAGKARTALIFTHEDGRPWGASHQLRPIAEASKRAKLDPLATFHILRHTYGSTLAMRGVPMRVIADQLGHADTRMTEKHYAHLAPNYVAEVVRSSMPRLGIMVESAPTLLRSVSRQA